MQEQQEQQEQLQLPSVSVAPLTVSFHQLSQLCRCSSVSPQPAVHHRPLAPQPHPLQQQQQQQQLDAAPAAPDCPVAPPSAACLPAPPAATAGAASASDAGGDGRALASSIARALGPGGLGIVLVTGVPGIDALRRALLPAARTLALMPPERDAERRHILASNGLGTDVPATSGASDRHAKGAKKRAPVDATSFAAGRHTFSATCQLKWRPGDLPAVGEPVRAPGEGSLAASVASPPPSDDCSHPPAAAGDILIRSTLDALGAAMVHVAALVAGACDIGAAEGLDTLTQEAAPRHGSAAVTTETEVPFSLERCLRAAGTAKARLIHYYASMHTFSGAPAAAEQGSGLGQRASVATQSRNPTDWDELALRRVADWQGWHFDYGLLTALVSPVYCCDDGAAGAASHCSCACQRPAESSPQRRQLCCCGDGLVVFDPRSMCPVRISIPPNADVVAIQVGEAAQILSGGRLAATAHCVQRPPGTLFPGAAPDASEPHDRLVTTTTASASACLSRQTFVVFMQPAWSTPMVPSLAAASVRHAARGPSQSTQAAAAAMHRDQRESVLASSQRVCDVLSRLLPPLASRWNWGTDASYAAAPSVEGMPCDGSGDGGRLNTFAALASAVTPIPTFSDFSKATTGAYYGTKKH